MSELQIFTILKLHILILVEYQCKKILSNGSTRQNPNNLRSDIKFDSVQMHLSTM